MAGVASVARLVGRVRYVESICSVSLLSLTPFPVCPHCRYQIKAEKKESIGMRKWRKK